MPDGVRASKQPPTCARLADRLRAKQPAKKLIAGPCVPMCVQHVVCEELPDPAEGAPRDVSDDDDDGRRPAAAAARPTPGGECTLFDARARVCVYDGSRNSAQWTERRWACQQCSRGVDVARSSELACT